MLLLVVVVEVKAAAEAASRYKIDKKTTTKTTTEKHVKTKELHKNSSVPFVPSCKKIISMQLAAA